MAIAGNVIDFGANANFDLKKDIEKPDINDAIREDALAVWIEEVAEIISSGCDAPGMILSLCSKEFLNVCRQSDLVISKGQGNYEDLSEERRPIYFLLSD